MISYMKSLQFSFSQHCNIVALCAISCFVTVDVVQTNKSSVLLALCSARESETWAWKKVISGDVHFEIFKSMCTYSTCKYILWTQYVQMICRWRLLKVQDLYWSHMTPLHQTQHEWTCTHCTKWESENTSNYLLVWAGSAHEGPVDPSLFGKIDNHEWFGASGVTIVTQRMVFRRYTMYGHCNAFNFDQTCLVCVTFAWNLPLETAMCMHQTYLIEIKRNCTVSIRRVTSKYHSNCWVRFWKFIHFSHCVTNEVLPKRSFFLVKLQRAVYRAISSLASGCLENFYTSC